MEYLKKLYKQYRITSFLLTIIYMLLTLVFIDYFNIFTLFYEKLGLPIIICIICLGIVKVLSLKFIGLFKLKSVNYVDFYSITALGTIILYRIMLYFFSNNFINLQYKIIGSNCIMTVTFLVILIRYIYMTSVECNKKNSNIKNVFDLKQLYDDKIPEETEFILVGDESVNYDLLERNKIINQITNTIINCNNDSKFVMSLKGAWGSGKTTILNNVKDKLSKENLVFIDDFEPWVYNDEKSLLVAFFDSIMKEINCGFRINEISKFTKIYLKTITSNIGYSIDNIFENNINIDRIKLIINNYLESNNKKIVLVLDNLERCSS